MTPENEVLAIAGIAKITSKVMVIGQIQGAIKDGADFVTGLKFSQARRILSGFDWRKKLLTACEGVADQSALSPTILPNDRSKWRQVREQYGNTFSYNKFAVRNGYVYDESVRLYIKS